MRDTKDRKVTTHRRCAKREELPLKETASRKVWALIFPLSSPPQSKICKVYPAEV